MPLTTAQLASLKTEIQTDPTALGYAAFLPPGADGAIAEILNWLRDGATACPTNGVVGPAVQVRRADITAAEIMTNVDMVDMPALANNPSSAQQSQERRDLAWLTGLSAIAGPIAMLQADGVTATQIRANLLRMFPAGTTTRTRLSTLEKRTGSRAESLFGTGAQVTDLEVGRALRG